MNALMECACEEGVQVSIDNNTAYVKVSRKSFGGEYLRMLDQLMKLHSEHNPTVWAFDLLEMDGFPLGLASVLLDFAQQVSNDGGEVRFTGNSQQPIALLAGQQGKGMAFGRGDAKRKCL